jgi:hypothetical protein
MKHRIFNASGKRPYFSIWWVVGLWLLLLATGCNGSQGLAVPAGFQPLAAADLAAHAYDAEVLAEFTLTETAVTTLFYTLPNADTPYFDLSLIGPDGSSLTILHSENYRTDENGGGSWEQTLTGGMYQLILTAEPSPGTLSVYWKHP